MSGRRPCGDRESETESARDEESEAMKRDEGEARAACGRKGKKEGRQSKEQKRAN